MITLRKNAERRIRSGHLWVFSNEVAQPAVSQLEPGSIHEICDAAGEFLGMGYANPSSLITARILSRKKTQIDEDFLRERIESALELRKRLFPGGDHYRLVYGESDGLPGLIVDRYGAYLAVQSLTAGMDALLDGVVASLVEIMTPEGVFVRNDSPTRTLEGIPLEKGLAYGTIPPLVSINSGELSFQVDIQNGQKTGFFLDQESNRGLMSRYVYPGAVVLDLFCYTGAWGIHALHAGASEVTGVDSSRGALWLAQSNAELNKFGDRFIPVRDSVIEFLKKAHAEWDLIILDPPAFIKSRSHIQEGRKGYIDANRRALVKLKQGGILVTCSCSHHLDALSLEEILVTAARQSGKSMRILDVRGQGPDHPILLSMPETRYLKVIAAQAM
jgi:23S rRNA (cytosine1962-C5)-methyltransferase